LRADACPFGQFVDHPDFDAAVRFLPLQFLQITQRLLAEGAPGLIEKCNRFHNFLDLE